MDECSNCYIIDRAKTAYCPNCKKVKKTSQDTPMVNVLDKIRSEIEEYKSRQLTLAIGVDDLEKGKQIALEYVLAIIDKYRGANDKY